jgi:hypothetical protein
MTAFQLVGLTALSSAVLMVHLSVSLWAVRMDVMMAAMMAGSKACCSAAPRAVSSVRPLAALKAWASVSQ